ncbi:hypothetical protein OIV83_001037 [Microbotryomycetes sp. JL201]|nr:hypothetical protein OIV83_001037 [Microbotryomycetes sp. JL201]
MASQQPGPRPVGRPRISKRGLFVKDLAPMMYGFGDTDPKQDTINVMEEILIEHITDVCTQAARASSGRGKLKVDDFKFALRHDTKKLSRVNELLFMNEVISRARGRDDMAQYADEQDLRKQTGQAQDGQVINAATATAAAEAQAAKEKQEKLEKQERDAERKRKRKEAQAQAGQQDGSNTGDIGEPAKKKPKKPKDPNAPAKPKKPKKKKDAQDDGAGQSSTVNTPAGNGNSFGQAGDTPAAAGTPMFQ